MTYKYVYTVIKGYDYEGENILKVFSSKSKARKYLKELITKKQEEDECPFENTEGDYWEWCDSYYDIKSYKVE